MTATTCGHHQCETNVIDIRRRRLLKGMAGVAAAGVALAASDTQAATEAARQQYADPAEPALPTRPFEVDLKNTALVVTDPQVDFLSPDGVTWGVVGESVKEQQTVRNIEKLFIAARPA